MSIKEQFKRALIRRLAYIAAAFLIATVANLFGMGKAFAHDHTCATAEATACDLGNAMEQAWSKANADQHCQQMWADIGEPVKGTPTAVQNGPDAYGAGFFSVTVRCEKVSDNWHLTGRGGEAPYYFKGTCLDRNTGMATTNVAGGLWGRSTGADRKCVSGCRFLRGETTETQTQYATTPGQNAVALATFIRAVWEYNGETCKDTPMETKDEEKPKTECTSAVNGVKVCKTKNNENCITSSAGRYLCWAPGENGSKTDGPVTQNKAPGNQPPGSLDGSTHTNTTNITNTTNNTTSTTTVNHYSTNNGSPAGPTNQGTGSGSDGKPTGNPGTGTGGTNPDGDDDTSSGGSGCESPPISSGNAILGNILQQVYAHKCNFQDSLGSLKGEGECSAQGTVVAFNCSGDSVGCALALRARERGCKEAQANQDLRDDGQLDQGDEPDGEIWGTEDGMPSLNPGLISLGGGQLLPTIDIEGQSVNLDEKIQGPIAAIRALVIAAFMVLAAFIAGGRP